MSHKDYTKFSFNKNKNRNNVVEDKNINLDNVKNITNIGIETNVNNESSNNVITTSRIVKAFVSNCQRLNVRKEASKESEVLKVLDVKTEIIVDIDYLNDDFYKVKNIIDNVDGYCMKDFITIIED